MASLDELTDAIVDASSTEEAVELLVDGLAARIKATSNDQNIQRLARDMRERARGLAQAIAGKKRVGTS